MTGSYVWTNRVLPMVSNGDVLYQLNYPTSETFCREYRQKNRGAAREIIHDSLNTFHTSNRRAACLRCHWPR